jgi:RNA polymerase sigma-70 factor (ECF subfamily)
VRHRQVASSAADRLRLLTEELRDTAAETSSIPDQRLALMFACAHPAIDPAIRSPLILQAVLGFNAQAIGLAFLVALAPMGVRLSRAKNKIRAAGIPLRTPERTDLRARLASVLEAIYGAYSSGWSDSAGADASLRSLAEEAIWLGRLVVDLLPREPEAMGLLALMFYSHARRPSR